MFNNVPRKLESTSSTKNSLLFIVRMWSPRDGALIGWLTAPFSPSTQITSAFSAIADVVALMVVFDGFGVVWTVGCTKLGAVRNGGWLVIHWRKWNQDYTTCVHPGILNACGVFFITQWC